jgi:hypothetical protein
MCNDRNEHPIILKIAHMCIYECGTYIPIIKTAQKIDLITNPLEILISLFLRFILQIRPYFIDHLILRI